MSSETTEDTPPPKLTYPVSMAGLTAYLPRLADLPDLAGRLDQAGFRTLSRTEVIGHGAADRDRAVANLLSGRAHQAAGAKLSRDDREIGENDPLTPGDVVTVTPGRGVMRLLASPCLVLTAGHRNDGSHLTEIDEMIYGSLPGHVECGEERFAVTLENDGTVTATVSAFSRPGRLVTRVGGPVARMTQRRMAVSYIRGMAQ